MTCPALFKSPWDAAVFGLSAEQARGTIWFLPSFESIRRTLAPMGPDGVIIQRGLALSLARAAPSGAGVMVA